MKGKIREIRSIWNTMNVSVRSRRLEVVGTRKNGRARRRHAREERKRTTVQADSQGHVSQLSRAYESCLACQRLFLTVIFLDSAPS